MRIVCAKNDPRRAGRELYAPRLPVERADLCAFAALERWLEVVGPDGPVFRTFDLRGPLTAKKARSLRRRSRFTAMRSSRWWSVILPGTLRRGIITNAAKKKVPIESIKRVTGQRSNAVVLDYVAAAALDEDPPVLAILDTRLS